MKKLIFTIILGVLLIPTFAKAATLIDNLEVERSADTYTFNMSRNSWTYTLYTDKETYTLNLNVVKVEIKDGEIVNPPTGSNLPIISLITLTSLGIIITFFNRKKAIYKL